MLNKKMLYHCLASLGLCFTLNQVSFASSPQHIIIAPSCLLTQLTQPIQVLSHGQAFTLAAVNTNQIHQLSEAKHHVKNCGGFRDVTAAWEKLPKKKNITLSTQAASFLKNETTEMTATNVKPIQYNIQYQTKVNPLLTTINPNNMWKNLAELSSFEDRYANSKHGIQAAAWIKTKIEQMARETGHDDVKVEYITTGKSYDQPSVIAKLGDSNQAGIVIGGHMDTLSSNFYGKMPGADDDGSGSVTVLEAARTILASGMHFKKPIYFVWYAAEEMGLVGSSYVVSSFQSKKIPVEAVVQFDMTGYRYKNDPTMWLMDDYVNKELTHFTEQLIATYAKQPVKHSRCGYACSDHASWHQKGIAAVMPFEANMNTMNPNIHASNDKMEHLSLDHMTNYAKLAVAFAVELAEPIN